MEIVLLFATILSPIVAALVELAKQTVNIKKNYLPLIALIIGIVVSIVAAPFTDLDLPLRLWSGAFAGLGATGLYELVAKRDGTTKDDDDQDIMDEKY